jgi:hypothetical protein
MKLYKLNTFIENIEGDISDGIITNDEALRTIMNYARFLRTELDINMFIGESKIFEGEFKESDCWEAGYDYHVKGAFIKSTTVLNSHLSSDIININDRTIEWLVDSFYGGVRVNRAGLRAYNIEIILSE